MHQFETVKKLFLENIDQCFHVTQEFLE